MHKRIPYSIIVFLVSCVLTCFMEAQSAGHESSQNFALFEEIRILDSTLFEAFNTGNASTHTDFFSEDIEFYHDKDGFSETKAAIVSSFDRLQAARADNSYDIRRELISGSLEVYPMSDYGALQIGRHQFYESYRGSAPRLTTKAKFIHLWKRNDDQWTISRVISFDHQPIVTKLHPDLPTIMLRAEVLKQYAGKYQFLPEFTLAIVIEGDQIFGEAQGDKVEMRPYAIHKFMTTGDNTKIEFILDDNDTITGMRMLGGNGEMMGKRIN